jgi:hypothetical protein
MDRESKALQDPSAGHIDGCNLRLDLRQYHGKTYLKLFPG